MQCILHKLSEKMQDNAIEIPLECHILFETLHQKNQFFNICYYKVKLQKNVTKSDSIQKPKEKSSNQLVCGIKTIHVALQRTSFIRIIITTSTYKVRQFLLTKTKARISINYKWLKKSEQYIRNCIHILLFLTYNNAKNPDALRGGKKTILEYVLSYKKWLRDMLALLRKFHIALN